MSSLSDKLQDKLRKREAQNALRKLARPDETLIDFYSNDYLGLSRRISSAEGKWGSTGSRLLGGNSITHEKFEKFLADFHKCDSALLFNSGYAANTGLISALLDRGDTFIYDELCHASIRDGLRLSLANSWSFLHNDLNDLEKKLQQAKGNIVVVVESVYSMDGHFAPIKELGALRKKYSFEIIVDEAHALGIFGEQGRGLVNVENLEFDIYARVITFGKAIGSHGAAVLGNKNLIEYLINFCRPFIYTTALPPVSISHLRQQYEYMIGANDERETLKKRIQFFRNEIAKNLKLKAAYIESESAVQSILFSGNSNVKEVSKKLLDAGLDVRPILSPTVPEGKERLRICLHSYNSEAEIGYLLKMLN